MPLQFNHNTGEFEEIDEREKKTLILGVDTVFIKGDKGDVPTPEDVIDAIKESVAREVGSQYPKIKKIIDDEVSKIPVAKDGELISSIEQIGQQAKIKTTLGKEYNLHVPSGKDGRGIQSVTQNANKLTVSFTDGKKTTFDLPPGQEIELRTENNTVQWRPAGGAWKDLFAIPKPKIGGGGNHYIKHMADVSIRNINNGDTLVYRASDKKFIPGTSSSGVQSFSVPIYQPHAHQAVLDKPFIFYIDPEQFASGITVTKAQLSTSASSTYSITLLDIADPTDGSPNTVTTVATSSSTEAYEEPNVDVDAGRYLALDLPTTNADYILFQIWFLRKS